jgi:hypothetical protein
MSDVPLIESNKLKQRAGVGRCVAVGDELVGANEYDGERVGVHPPKPHVWSHHPALSHVSQKFVEHSELSVAHVPFPSTSSK